MTFKLLADSICCTKPMRFVAWSYPVVDWDSVKLPDATNTAWGKVNGYKKSFSHLGEPTARSQNYRKIKNSDGKNSDGIIECLCEDAGALMISLWQNLKGERVESNSHSTV